MKSGYTVPWEIQSVNTCPENFIWEQDNVSIIAVTPGLYEVFFGFFTSKKPVIQLLINGETVIMDVSGEGKSARARICVSYSGPRVVEGFLSLRKL